MKKKSAILLGLAASIAAVIAVYLCICSPAEIPTKEMAYLQLDAKGEEFVLEQIKETSREQLIESWGEPDGMLSGFFGDVWKITENECMIVYYSSESKVEQIKFIQKTEQAGGRPPADKRHRFLVYLPEKEKRNFLSNSETFFRFETFTK